MWETFKDLLENQISRGRHNRKVLRLHFALRFTSTNVRHHFGIVALAPHSLEKRWDVSRLVNAFHSNMRLICINDPAGVELVARPNKGTFDTSLYFISFILLHIAETVVFSPAHYRLESSLQGTEGWSSIWTRQMHGFGNRCSICYTLHDIPSSQSEHGGQISRWTTPRVHAGIRRWFCTILFIHSVTKLIWAPRERKRQLCVTLDWRMVAIEAVPWAEHFCWPPQKALIDVPSVRANVLPFYFDLPSPSASLLDICCGYISPRSPRRVLMQEE